MSIIENAVKRLNKNRDVPPVVTSPLADDTGAQRNAEFGILPESHLPLARSPVAHHAAPRRYAELNLERLHKRGIVVPGADRNAVCEEFRIVKRPLLRNVIAERMAGKGSVVPSNVIMVTSSVPGEGKTHCAINLAMSIATEKDFRVLLVDADVARPAISKTLCIPGEPGLMDILQEGGPDVAAAMIHTNVPSLTLIPAGESNRLATELLASSRMTQLIAELAQRYPDRLILFDSPPLLTTTEPQALSSHMGQIVFVVEAERTTQKQVKEALRFLDGCPHVGLVYNKARRFGRESMYGYY